MKSFVYINKKGQEMICQGTPYRYLDVVLKYEESGYLPKGLYSSKDMINSNEEWCNTLTCGHYKVPKLEGVIVPNGTINKLGIELKGQLPLSL